MRVPPARRLLLFVRVIAEPLVLSIVTAVLPVTRLPELIAVALLIFNCRPVIAVVVPEYVLLPDRVNLDPGPPVKESPAMPGALEIVPVTSNVPLAV